MNILGQEKLLSKLNLYTSNTFPKSSIVLGPFGCGKHLFARHVATKFNLELIDITENISQEFIESIYLRVIPTLYVIDASKIVERQQNMILKFLEEPSIYTFIIILAENRVSLLPTILNRCVEFEFEQYTRETLLQFVDDSIDKELALSVCVTPGQLKLLKMTNLSELKELCLKMAKKTAIASFPNMLSISDKLNYKDEFDKYDVNIFLNMVIQTLSSEYKMNNDKKIFDMYMTTLKYTKMLRDKRLNKRYIIEKYLSDLWKEARSV
jgi:replication-associated recombination protein RarA